MSRRARRRGRWRLRTVERAAATLPRELAAAARAMLRFETPPGKRMQIGFGERRVLIVTRV